VRNDTECWIALDGQRAHTSFTSTAGRPMKLIPVLASVVALSLTQAWPVPLCQTQNLDLNGVPDSIERRAELSAVATRGGYLLVLSNEAIGSNENYHAIQVFEPAGEKSFRWVRDEIIHRSSETSCANADFEAMTLAGNHLYIVGSHSSSHKKQNSEKSYNDNRKILTDFETDNCDSRYMLSEYKIDGSARVESPPRNINLHRIIRGSKLLSAFSAIPSKENGVDIEGLAVSNDNLYVGFRGPVLRNNFVPVLRMKISDEEDFELLFVKLDGRGIRDIVAVANGFLIIGGPVGDRDMPFTIYHWDGDDMVIGHDRPVGGMVKPLCTLPPDDDGKPEGISVVSWSTAGWEAVIVYDSSKTLLAKRAWIPLN
jgi:hypothetical protein